MSNRRCRYRTKISEAAMENAYATLRTLTVEQLEKAKDLSFEKFSSHEQEGMLFRHQVDFVIERKLSGRW